MGDDPGIRGRSGTCGLRFFMPVRLIQELLYKVPFPKKKLWKGFTWIKYILLVVFVLMLPVVKTNAVGSGAPAFCEYICPVGTLEEESRSFPHIRNCAV